MLESWPRIGNIDPFFVTAAPTVANESFSLNVYVIPMNGRCNPEGTRKPIVCEKMGENRAEKKPLFQLLRIMSDLQTSISINKYETFFSLFSVVH